MSAKTITLESFVVACMASALVTGCSATPVPEPPPAAPGEPSEVNGPGFGAAPICPVPLTLTGRAEPGLSVWGLRLDTTANPECDPIDLAPVEVSVPDSGEFTLELDVLPLDEIRLQLRDGDLRGPPVDFVVGVASGPLARAARDECLSVDLERDLGDPIVGESTELPVSVRNACAGPVRLETLTLRANVPAFSVVTQAPIDVAAGSQTAVTVQFSPQTVGPSEEILFVSTSGSVSERRAVTLYGSGR